VTAVEATAVEDVAMIDDRIREGDTTTAEDRGHAAVVITVEVGISDIRNNSKGKDPFDENTEGKSCK
jgi:hypothetical protein